MTRNLFSIFVGRDLSISWCVALFGLAKRIDEIGNEIFVLGSLFEDFDFVFDDDFVVGDFDNFFTWNSELGVDETLNDGAFYNDLLDEKIVRSNGEVNEWSEFGAFLGLDF